MLFNAGDIASASKVATKSRSGYKSSTHWAWKFYKNPKIIPDIFLHFIYIEITHFGLQCWNPFNQFWISWDTNLNLQLQHLWFSVRVGLFSSNSPVFGLLSSKDGKALCKFLEQPELYYMKNFLDMASLSWCGNAQRNLAQNDVSKWASSWLK